MGPEIEVLLAEDDASDAELIRLSLERAQVAGPIHRVLDGEEALDFLFCRGSYADRVDASPVKLIVLDLKLPKVDGLEVLKEIKGDPRTRTIPVILLTSSKLHRDVVEAYRLGVNSYVQKPVDFTRFREVVRDIGQYWLGVNEPPAPEHLSEVE